MQYPYPQYGVPIYSQYSQASNTSQLQTDDKQYFLKLENEANRYLTSKLQAISTPSLFRRIMENNQYQAPIYIYTDNQQANQKKLNNNIKKETPKKPQTDQKKEYNTSDDGIINIEVSPAETVKTNNRNSNNQKQQNNDTIIITDNNPQEINIFVDEGSTTSTENRSESEQKQAENRNTQPYANRKNMNSYNSRSKNQERYQKNKWAK